MRFVAFAGAIYSLLSPNLILAQCENEDWFSFTTLLPGGGAGVQYLATERFTVSTIDSSLYRVDMFQAGPDNMVDLVVNNVNHQIPAVTNEKVLVVQKLDASGQLQWLNTGIISNNGSVHGLTIDDLGNVYVGGTYSGIFTYNGDTLFQMPDNLAGGGHFTLMILPNGELGWHRSGYRGVAVRHCGTENGLLLLISMSDSVTFDGQTYFRQTPVTPGTNEYLVLAVNSEGSVIWHNYIEGSGLKTARVTAVGNAKCIIQGNFSGDLKYGNLLTSNGEGRLYQIGLNYQTGSGIWMKVQDNSGTETSIETFDSEFISNGNIVTVGQYNGNPSSFSFQGQTISSPNGLTDGFVMCQNANDGELLWLKSLGAPGYSVVFAAARTATGVAVGGYFDGPELYYEGTLLTNHSNNKDPVIMILDVEGKPECHFDNIGTEDHDVISTIISLNNELFVFMPVIDSISFGDHTFISLGSDQVIWKTCLPCDTLTSVTEATTTQPIVFLYPNPANQSVRVEVQSSTFNVQSLSVTDMLGQVVQNLEPRIGRGRPRTLNFELDIAGLLDGVYTVAVQDQTGQLLRQRLVVQH